MEVASGAGSQGASWAGLELSNGVDRGTHLAASHDGGQGELGSPCWAGPHTAAAPL